MKQEEIIKNQSVNCLQNILNSIDPILKGKEQESVLGILEATLKGVVNEVRDSEKVKHIIDCVEKQLHYTPPTYAPYLKFEDVKEVGALSYECSSTLYRVGFDIIFNDGKKAKMEDLVLVDDNLFEKSRTAYIIIDIYRNWVIKEAKAIGNEIVVNNGLIEEERQTTNNEHTDEFGTIAVGKCVFDTCSKCKFGSEDRGHPACIKCINKSKEHYLKD